MIINSYWTSTAGMLSNFGDVSNASKKASELMAAIDATKVNQTVTNLADASEGAREVVADISKVSRRVGGRADDIDKMITDASQLAAQLNQSAGKLDETLDGINRLVGSDEANGVMADARATLAEFRKTAQNLNAQVSSVARGINNFTGRGLADTQGLIRDARRSLSRIDRVISNLEQNPASLFTGGGSGIRESGRPRR